MRFGAQKEDGSRGEIVYEDGTLLFDGVTLSAKDWVRLNKRVEAVLRREGLTANPQVAPVPRATSFILENLSVLNKMKRGKVRTPPWPLRLFYDAVVTKVGL